MMKTPACSTACPKIGKRVKNLGALVLLCVGLIFAGTIAAGESSPDLLNPAERAWLVEHPEKVFFSLAAQPVVSPRTKTC
jgi:hypothetical protein